MKTLRWKQKISSWLNKDLAEESLLKTLDERRYSKIIDEKDGRIYSSLVNQLK